ncbi:glutamate-cysteine ligase family protein [Nostoc sp.]|uniref:glutamate-cysteine ligase family protein n=2 Tax=Nostoc TaxID=1177 RepID=UPI001DDD20F7|nr:hypothetical protein [Nostoc sp. JL23]
MLSIFLVVHHCDRETGKHPLFMVSSELVRLRREVITAADKDGNQIAAAGTHPFSHWDQQHLTPKERYQDMRFGS